MVFKVVANNSTEAESCSLLEKAVNSFYDRHKEISNMVYQDCMIYGEVTEQTLTYIKNLVKKDCE